MARVGGLWRMSELPGPIRRLRRVVLFTAPFAFVLVLCGVFDLGGPSSNYYLPACALIVAGTIAVTHVLERRVIARVRKAHFAACPECTYSLEGVEGTGKCPECGRPYATDKLREEWTRLLGWGPSIRGSSDP